MQRPLRFGIMCRSLTFDAWQAAAILKLIESGNGVAALLIVDSGEAPREAPFKRLWRKITAPNLLWRLFGHVSRPRAQQGVDLTAALRGTDQIHCKPLPHGRFGQTLSEEDVAKVRACELDFVLRFGFGILRGEILSAPRYGVWSFHHGDELRYRGGPPCFWEMYRGDSVTGAILQRLTERLDAGIVLRKGYLRTIAYSYARSVDQLFFETADWPAYVASDIRRGLIDRLNSEPSATDAKVHYAPSNAQMFRFLAKLFRSACRRLRERRLKEEWNIGAARAEIADVLAGKQLRDVRWMGDVSNGWLADPIALAQNGHVQVFCERMDLRKQKAHICSLKFDGRTWTEPLPAIESATHASYPYVFRYDDDFYCIPESYEANAVHLYRAKTFPSTWEPVATLLRDVAAVDSTLFEHDRLLWLFCTHQEASATRLYAYYARNLLGPWEPHARNPVKIDVRGARPAGPPFRHDGILYRPAQDSSLTYGGRVVIQRILSLSPTDFDEVPHAYVEPDRNGPFREGLHTLSFAGRYCIIDGKRMRRK